MVGVGIMVGRVMRLRGAIVYCGLVRIMGFFFPETGKKNIIHNKSSWVAKLLHPMWYFWNFFVFN